MTLQRMFLHALSRSNRRPWRRSLLSAACMALMLLCLFGPSLSSASARPSGFVRRAIPPGMASIQHIWFIMFENHSWSDIAGNTTSAPYINNTLLPQASYSTNHWDPSYGHPSLPAYIDLEAGSNLGITNDNYPGGIDEQSTTSHFVTQLVNANRTWKGYIEGITGTSCPLTDNNSTHYAVRHNPQMYFADVTNNNSSSSSNCIAHERPFTQLSTDLKNNTVANYNYILPELCHDMHTQCGTTTDEIKSGDTWLSTTIPMILNSTAYKQSGAIFISWDEGTDNPNGTDSNGPIGLIVLSPFAKGGGYVSSVFTDHNSTLLTFEEIFGLPALRNAQTATDLSDLFN